MKIPFNKPFIAGHELDYILDAVKSGQLSGDGPYTKRCHAWLEQNTACKKALLTHSCTAALEMAAILCDIQPGDEVIMPSFTFVSTANAFVLRGGVPVFVDVRADTLNLDERLIEAAITPRTKVIVPVHYAGVPCEMDTIMAIAEKHQLLVVEDAAQALLSSYKGKRPGAIGHMGCLSFHETKNVISGEGGALLINDERFIQRAEIIREKGTNRSQFFRGQVDKYTWVDIGSSYLPGELTAAFLFAQLEHAQEIIAVRKKLCQRYAEELCELEQSGRLRMGSGMGKTGVQPGEAEVTGNGHIFYLLLDQPETRAALAEHLKAQDMLAVSHYVSLHTSPAAAKYARTGSAMPVTDHIHARLLRLPLYYGMSEQDQGRVIAAVKSFFADR